MHQYLIKGIGFFVLLLSGSVIATDKVPEPTSWNFPAVIEEARKISPVNSEGKKFNQFGLAYSKKQLSQIDFSTTNSIKLQIYADIVTHAYPDAVAKLLPKSCENIPVTSLNETTIANFAYIAHNAQSSKTRVHAKSCLDIIQSKLIALQ